MSALRYEQIRRTNLPATNTTNLPNPGVTGDKNLSTTNSQLIYPYHLQQVATWHNLYLGSYKTVQLSPHQLSYGVLPEDQYPTNSHPLLARSQVETELQTLHELFMNL